MPDPRSEAKRHYQSYRVQREAGEDPDFEVLCATHPELEEELRALERSEGAAGQSGFSFFLRALPSKLDDEVAALPGPARAGDQLGDFRLIELVDRGGQGEVWIAEQLSLRRRVALKLMLPGRGSTRARELFLREARAGGRLSHPGIVTVHGQGTAEGHAWIAMELVEGGCTLVDSLVEVSGLDELPPDYHRRVAELVAQIADALQAAHDAGVIHRDVKPHNILVTEDDQVKVTDFGLARIVDEEALSRTGDFMGTYAYMSPEQVAARRAGIDHRTDVFSLGAVLYELLSLRRPFDGETTHEVAEKILTAEPPDLTSIDPAIPADLAVICLKALEKARQDRFQSMRELAAELRRFLAGEPIVTLPPTRAQLALRWIRRHPAARAVAVTSAAAALVLWAVTRPEAVVPFTGPDYEQLIVTQSPAHEDSPTFVRDRFLVFERREDERADPRLWTIDLESDLSNRPWSPDGVACGAPAISPEGKWLAYEAPLGRDPRRTAIEIRRLAALSEGLAWPEEVQERIEPTTGSFVGVVWGRSSRFVYTHEDADGRTLLLHDLTDPGSDDVELHHVSRRDYDDTGPFQACFEPGEDRVLVADRDELLTISFGEEVVVSTRTMDCGDSWSPVWLWDDSVLLARVRAWEASPRLYRLTDSGTARVPELETHLIGGYTRLAVSPDAPMLAPMLALVDRVERSEAWIASPDDAEPTDLLLRYPPVHPVWSPDGRLVYAGDTGRGFRLNVYDPVDGTDELLELDLSFLQGVDEPYQLDQLAFSQNGRRFLFRARYEPRNGTCDPEEWIVVTPWPVDPAQLVAIPMEGRHIAFPHVDDQGGRVVWYEEIDGAHRILGAEVVDGRLGQVEERVQDALWLARLSGDGELIAAPREDQTIHVVDWDGNEIATIDEAGFDRRPRWLPEELGAGLELSYFHQDIASPEEFALHAVSPAEPERPRELCRFRSPSRTLQYMIYDALDRRVVFVATRVEGGNIWLIRPTT
jgi:hypothetical protein